MATNIEITAQMNKMLAEQNQLYLAQAKIQKGQLAIMQAMAEAMGTVDVSAMNESMKSVTDQLTAAEEAVKKLGQTTQATATATVTSQIKVKSAIDQVADAIERGAEEAEKYKLNIIASASAGATKGFQLTFNVITSIVGVLSQAASKVGQFAMAVLRFPFSIWNFLFEKATSGGGGGDLRQTLEGIRKEFGDLSKNSSKAIIDMAKSMKGELANTGLSVYRTFGMLADRLKYVAGLAKALGPIFNLVFQRDMIKNVEAVGAFQKGLGLSDEQMKTVARTALISGRTVDESLREMSNYAIQLGDAFGYNAMEISRDMAELEGDMKHFGGLTRKELGETVVYAKRLGIEVKSLAGIMDTFDNFDSAAEAAARLNQQFGIQVDAMRLMKAESPAERLEELRKGLERTGRSFEGLDRRSQQYLATTVGMSQEEAALAFAQANRGLSLDQIKKKSAEAEKKQLTQAEAMQKLAGSIERLVKGGGGGVKSLFEAFVQGFERAIFRSREFRQIMRNIRIMLKQTRIAGMQVGRAFLDMMPGFKGILTSLGDLFNPTRWKNTLNKVVETFKAFFKDLQTNPEAGLKNLFERLKKTFFDHFDASSGAGRKLIENFKLFFGTVLKAVVGGLKALIPMAFEALTKLIKGINGFLRGEIGLPIDTKSIGGQIMEVLSQLWNIIKEAWPPLWEAIKEMFSIVFSKIQAWYNDHRLQIWGFLFGPALVRGIISGLSAALIQGMTKAFATAATSSAVKTAASALTSRITGVTQLTERDITFLDRKRATPPPIPAVARKGVPAGATEATGGLTGFIKSLQAVTLPEIGAAGLKLIAISFFMAAALVPFLGLFGLVVLAFKDFGAGDITKAVVVMVAASGLIVTMGLLTKALKTINPTELGQASVALAGVSGLLLILAGVMWASISLLGSFPIENVLSTIAILGAGELLMLGMAGLAHVLALVGAEIAETAGIGYAAVVLGLVGLGALIVGLAYVMKTAIEAFGTGFDFNQANKVVEILSAGELLLLGASATIGSLVASGALIVGFWPFALAGIVATGLLITNMVPTIKNVMDSIRELPVVDETFVTKLGAVNSILEALGTFANIFVKVSLAFSLAAMLPLLLAIGGPVMAAIGGIVALFAMYKLPDMMDGLIDNLAEVIQSVSERVNEISPDRLRLLQAIGPVIESIGTLITALQPPTGLALLGSILPTNTANTIREYFTQILPVLTGEDGLLNVVSKFTSSIGAISTRNFNAEAVKSFGSILSGLGSIIGAFADMLSGAGGEEGLGANIARGIAAWTSLGLSEIFRSATAGDEFSKKIGAITGFAQEILQKFNELGIFESITNIIRVAASELRTLSKEQIQGIAPIGQMISSIFSFFGTMIQNLKIEPEILDALQEADEGNLSTIQNVVHNIPGDMAASFASIVATVKTELSPVIRVLMTAVTGFSETDIKKAAAGAEAVMSILTGIGTFMTTIKELGTTESFGTAAEGLASGPPPVIRNFDRTRITELIGSMGQIVDAVFGGENAGMIKTIVNSLIGSGIARLPRGIGEKAKAVADILQLVSVFSDPNFAQNVGQMMTSGITGLTHIDVLLINSSNMIRGIVNTFGGLFGEREFRTSLQQFNKANMANFENIGTFVSSLGNLSTSLGANFTTAFNQVTLNMTDMKGNIEKIITEASQILTTINSMTEFNVPASLTRLSSFLGLSGNNTLTLSERNININVTVDVHVDARELERVLIERPRSRFQERATPGAGASEQ